MKLDKIDDARILINKRDTLLDVLAKHETWKNGHFELVEHCGSSQILFQGSPHALAVGGIETL